MDDITQIHEQVLAHLLKMREVHENLFFVPRKINNNQRLTKGYWFIGNEQYIHVSFWNGMDWKEKIHNIGFVVHADGTSKIELSAQDSQSKARFIEVVAKKIGGFEKQNTKSKWLRHYTGTDYIKSLDNFLNHVKPRIDDFVRKDKSKDILPLDENFFTKYMKKILGIREKYDFGVYADLFDEPRDHKKGITQKNTDEKLVAYSGRYLRRAIHNRIQQDIFNSLVQKLGKDCVMMEENLVDIVIVHNNLTELIEIKPYESVILCIREGLGQLLSYYHTHYFDRRHVLLKIIGPNEPSHRELEFVEFIKRTLQIRFEYQGCEQMKTYKTK